jgi:hypothetical protein
VPRTTDLAGACRRILVAHVNDDGVLAGPSSDVAMPLSDDQRRRIRDTFAAFLDARARNLKRLTLDDMKFNVVHLRTIATMLDFETPEDLLRYSAARSTSRPSSRSA